MRQGVDDPADFSIVSDRIGKKIPAVVECNGALDPRCREWPARIVLGIQPEEKIAQEGGPALQCLCILNGPAEAPRLRGQLLAEPSFSPMREASC